MVGAEEWPEATGEGFVPPSSYSVDRYEGLWERSPFLLSSAPTVAPTPTGPGFADHLVLAGVAQVGGQYHISLVDKTSLQRKTLRSGVPNETGMEVVEVELQRDPMQTHVVVRRGGEQAVVRYDRQLLSAAVSQPAAAATQTPAEQVTEGAVTAPRSGRVLRQPSTQEGQEASEPSPQIRPRRRVILPGQAGVVP